MILIIHDKLTFEIKQFLISYMYFLKVLTFLKYSI